MKVVVAGGTGFIGGLLAERLSKRADVVVLSRQPSKVRHGRGVAWNPPQAGAWTSEIADADVVVNLAGENIGAGRWTDARKRALESSRLDATRALVEARKNAPKGERTLINASAVGFYGNRGDEALDESAGVGTGFLAEITSKWEAAARAAEPFARLVIARFGVVLDDGGGALAKMLLPFKLGVGGRIGSGEQWMSWVDREDVIRFLDWGIDQKNARGIYNVTSPEPVRNRDFVKALGRALHRPTVMPVPGFMLHALFGQMADETILGGQRVVPVRAMSEGFTFAHPKIEESLRHAMR